MATRTRKYLFRVVGQTYQSLDILAESEQHAIDLFHNAQYQGSAKLKQTLEDNTSYEVEAYELHPIRKRFKKGEYDVS